MLSPRKMQKSDLADVVNIEREANQFPWSRKNFEDSLKANHMAWVFLDDINAIVGFTIIQKVVDEVHILNICIKPGVQGQGHGRDVLNYIIDYAKTISSAIIVLEVRSSNKRAQYLYLGAGFNEMSVRKNYYPAAEGRENALLMGMDLSFL